MGKETNSLYKFDEFCVDGEESVLTLNGEIIPLAPKVFDTLFAIIKRQGSIISKEELMDEVWADSFVEEGNLTQNIYTLRQVFGKDNNFIETIPRRGYRFSADLRVIEAEGSENLVSEGKRDVGAFQTSRTDNIAIAKSTSTKTNREEVFEINKERHDEAKPQTTRIANSSRSLIKTKGLFIVLVIGVLTLSGVGFWLWSEANSASHENLFSSVKLQSLTDTGNLLFVSISPDGKYLACVKGKNGGEKSLWLKDLKLNRDVKLELSSDFNLGFVKFSADGDSIYFRNLKGVNQTSDIYKTSKFGGSAKLIAKDVWSEFDFSPDDKQIAFYRRNMHSNENYLVVKNLIDGKEKNLATKSFPEGFLLGSAPTWSSNGNEIIAISRLQRRLISKMLRIDVESGKEKKIETPQFRVVLQTASLGSDDELIVAARERKKFAQLYKVKISDGSATRITNDLNNYRRISLSSDNKNLIALQKITFSNIWLIPDAEANKSKQLTFGKLGREGRQGLTVLPDGKILYTSIESKNRDLWLVDPNSGLKRQLTENKGDVNDHPFVSPKGNSIYFDNSDKGTRNIHRIDLDASNTTEITSNEKSNDIYPVISPDGKQLYFLRQSKGNSAIWRKSLPDGQPEKLPLAKKAMPSRFLSISPDGKFLAFGQAASRNSPEITNASVDSINIAIISLSNSASEPKFFQIPTNRPVIRWTKTNDSFDFVGQTNEGATIWRKSIFDNNPSEAIVKLPNTEVYDFYWSPNNNDLIVSQGKNQDDAVLIIGF